MARERKRAEISFVPDMVRLAREVQVSREPRLLTHDGEEVAVLSPVPTAPKRRRKSGLVTKDDRPFGLAGIGESKVPGGVSGDKHVQLAGALRHE